MPTFDGDNLIMTLDATASQDVLEDWYEGWKDWHRGHPDNRKYPQLFLSEGGGPVDLTQSQGAYIRCNNDAGWRIRPPEQDIEITYTGSLLRTNDDLPIFIPTIGAYSTQVFNIQPITTIVESTSNLTAAGVWSYVIESEGNYTAKDAMNIGLAALAGEVSISGNTITFKTPNGNVTRMISEADADGQRTSIILTPAA